MKHKLLLIVISAITLASCSTAYKNIQTPDDVYFSPLRPEVAEKENDNEDQVNNQEAAENREIIMKTRDRRWRDLDRDYDYDYTYHPYKYGYTYGYYYNPYYYNYPIYMPGIKYVNPKNTSVRMTNLGTYNTNTVTSINPKTGVRETKTGRIYNNNNNTSIRRVIILPGESNNRTYSPSNSNRSSSSSSGNTGSSGSGRSVTRPSRGN